MKNRVLPLALLVLAACVTPILPRETPDVDEYAREYNNDVRWGRWQEAAAQVEPERRSAFLKLLDEPDRPYRFTSVDVLTKKPLSDDGTEMELLVGLEYYRLPSVQERKVRQVQKWRYDVTLEKWVVTPDLSVLREDVSSGRDPR
ncbi:MAG TPA: hypothetical protein VKF60_17340 [Myxococcota bacterium]|nr:hypothetical protein [Myxococcota bacterium]